MLIDQLKHEDITARINAYKNISKIAEALGPERTRKELIPFMVTCCDDDDEVIIVLAEKLGELTNFVGGPEFAYFLLQPIEILLSCEESQVRDLAIQSLRIVLSTMPDNQIAEFAVVFAKNLCNKEWFPARISAAIVIPVVHDRVTQISHRTELETMFLKLCGDDTPMVRRYAASNLGNMYNNAAMEDMLVSLKRLAQDDQDSVRIQSMLPCVELAAKVSKEVMLGQLVPLVISLASDKSWRVRWAVANGLDEFCRNIGQDAATANFGIIFDSLLNDFESEVRTIALLKLPSVTSNFRCEVTLSKIVPSLHRMVNDPSEHVRIAQSRVINDMARVLSKNDVVEHLLPIILLLLRDESSEVRLNIISNLTPINDSIGVDLLSQSLLPSIMGLSEDPKWRVRQSIILIVPTLARQLGRDFFNEKLCEMCLNWLSDSVSEIRKTASENIRQLTELLGEDWARENVLPHLERMSVHTNYLQKATSLLCLRLLVEIMSPAIVEANILPLATAAASDNVANIRYASCKVLIAMVMRNELKVVSAKASTLLSRLASDKDPDVRHLVEQALVPVKRTSS